MEKKDTRFKKGQSGNPGGRPKLTDDMKRLSKLSKTSLEAAMNKFLHIDRAGLKVIANDPASTMLDIAIASILTKAVTQGDQQRLDWIVSRLIGKVTDKVKVDMPRATILERAKGDEQLVLGAAFDKED